MDRNPHPLRMFSSDGSTFYLSVYQLGHVRLMAVDLKTGQITFSPYGGGVRLMDIRDDVMLVKMDADGDEYLSRAALGIGRLHDDYW
jgi:hypothetical protein